MEVTDPKAHVNPSIEKISRVWGSSLSAANFEALNRRGYLTYELADKLLVITLNTVPYSVRSRGALVFRRGGVRADASLTTHCCCSRATCRTRPRSRTRSGSSRG